jgi:YD repeat-containing protein
VLIVENGMRMLPVRTLVLGGVLLVLLAVLPRLGALPLCQSWPRWIVPRAHASDPPVGGGAVAMAGDPVNLATGLYLRRHHDFVLQDPPGVVFTRTYRNQDFQSRPFGIGTSHPYELFLIGDNAEGSYAELIQEDGGRVHLRRVSPWFSAPGYLHEATPSRFFGARLRLSLLRNWELCLADGTRYTFPRCSSGSRVGQCAVSGFQDGQGRALTLTRDREGDLVRIATPRGQWLALQYDRAHRITEGRDSEGRVVSYGYDAGGRLVSVTYGDGRTFAYVTAVTT